MNVAEYLKSLCKKYRMIRGITGVDDKLITKDREGLERYISDGSEIQAGMAVSKKIGGGSFFNKGTNEIPFRLKGSRRMERRKSERRGGERRK